MDTALITFMLQTTPSTRSVDLVGSWDNFTKRYPMDRDIKRGGFRGCYTFQDIICDGDVGNRRSGGLKMGSTYYYYYEINGSTESHNPLIPSTTSCPYLPGQTVNLLYVPIEIQPLRHRSASTSAMTIADIMTMNPADKFMAPRQPPPTPPLPRLNTSSSVLLRRRNTRSVSPDVGKASWSPRTFFGLRVPTGSSASDVEGRGRRRSSSMTKAAEKGADTLHSSFVNRSDDPRKIRSGPPSREPSPLSFGRSREPSPMRSLPRDSSSYYAAAFEIPDEIAEEAEEADDDANFAHHLARISMSERGIVTGLSPPPARTRSPTSSITSALLTSKPLPLLPQESRLPSPLRTRLVPWGADMPGSHFSTSTISTHAGSPTTSTNPASPTESHSGFSETPSMSDCNDEDDVSARSTLAEERDWRGFSGYSLPEAAYASELTIRKEPRLTQPASRKTFGEVMAGESADAAVAVSVGHETGDGLEGLSVLEQLLIEMGYLGDFIERKEMI